MNNDQVITVNRVFVAVVTDKDIEPGMPGFDGQWVTHKDNKAALEPIEHMLRIPNNAILVASVQEGMALLSMVKDKLMPNMSNKSGLQMCVVHTEAILVSDPSQNSLQATALLFPMGYLSMEVMEMEQKIHQENLEIKAEADIKSSSPVGETEKQATFTVVAGGKESSCEICGKSFTPDNPMQPACNECLNIKQD